MLEVDEKLLSDGPAANDIIYRQQFAVNRLIILTSSDYISRDLPEGLRPSATILSSLNGIEAYRANGANDRLDIRVQKKPR